MSSANESIDQFNQLLEITRMRVDQVSAALAELNDRGATAANGLAGGGGNALAGSADRAASLGNSISRALQKGGSDLEDSMSRSLQTALQIARVLSTAGGARGASGGLFSFLGGLLSLIGGFESGGYTGNIPGSRPAGIVHGGEVVFEKPIVDLHRESLLALRKRLNQGAGLPEAVRGIVPVMSGAPGTELHAVLLELRNLREAWRDVRIEPAITIGQSFDTQRFFIDGDAQLQTYKRKKLV